MATHSRILAWRIPWTEEPGGLQSMESQRIGHGWSNLAQMHTEDLKNLPKVTPSFLSMCVAGISPFHADSWTNQLNGANQSDSCSWKEEQALSLWNNRWEKKKNENGFPPKANQCALSCPIENTWEMLPFSCWKSGGIINLLLFLSFSGPSASSSFLLITLSHGEGNAPHSSALAWKTPWTEEPGGLQSMRSLRVGHDWSDLAAAAAALSHLWV